jgi:LuxR family maltose regulon positive regulatory protein
MESPLLSTKLFIPPLRPGWIPRPRLLERMRAVLDNSLTLVSAPAGFGKTTLVSAWVQHTRPPAHAAWLSLEEADNNPVRFWGYVIAALNTLYPAAGQSSLRLLHSSPSVPPESMLTVLINDLSSIAKDFTLVLDDYHFIQTPAIHQVLSFLLEHLPSKMHLVIATRVDPLRDKVFVEGKQAIPLEDSLYLVMNKPKDTITTMNDVQYSSSPSEPNTSDNYIVAKYEYDGYGRQ